jgi:hypothetical protein
VRRCERELVQKILAHIDQHAHTDALFAAARSSLSRCPELREEIVVGLIEGLRTSNNRYRELAIDHAMRAVNPMVIVKHCSEPGHLNILGEGCATCSPRAPALPPRRSWLARWLARI